MGVRDQSPARPTRRQVLKRAVLASAGVLSSDALLIEPRLMMVDTAKVPVAGLPAAFEGYRILHLTDTHCGRWISPEFIRRSIERGLAFKPDLIVFTGDMFDGHNHTRPLPHVRSPFEGAKAPDGQLLVLGNHDAWCGGTRTRKAILDQTPFEIVENRHRMVERKGSTIAIVGLGDLWTGTLDFEKAFKGIPPETPRILLQHNPDLAEDSTDSNRVDLQLSGHTHGGQMRFPWGHAPRVPSKYGDKFLEGLVQGRNNPVFVCRGIGGGGPFHPRLFCPPQISLVELVRSG